MGKIILRDAILRTLQAAEIGGIRAILVHAISEDAKRFYERYGFTSSPIDPMTLMVAVGDAKKAVFDRLDRPAQRLVDARSDGAGAVSTSQDGCYYPRRRRDGGCRRLAGAAFLTSAGLDMKIVEFALGASVVVFTGALTPTEVTRAWKAGADFVKVFPCGQVGGENYIRALKAPFPDLPLIAWVVREPAKRCEFYYGGSGGSRA